MTIFSVLVILMIFRTASRTALIVAIVALAGGLSLCRHKVLAYLLAGCVLLTVWTHGNVFENTAMWQRIENTENDMEKMYFADTWLAKIMGDRSSYYFGGWEIFSKHPVNGVGLNNYIFHNPFAEFVCHVEIMAQLSEEGILGAIIFLLFYGAIAWQLWKTRKFKSLFEWRFCLVLFLSICFVNFASYTSMRSVYYMFFGYIIGCLERLRAQAKIEDPSAYNDV